MSTLDVKIDSKVPKTFIRGQTLEFLMELPCDVPALYFQDTTVQSELRQIQNAGVMGFISVLEVNWEPDTDFTKLRFRAEETDTWPLGPAEFDVLFHRFVNGDLVRRFRSVPMRILITDGVTA